MYYNTCIVNNRHSIVKNSIDFGITRNMLSIYFCQKKLKEINIPNIDKNLFLNTNDGRIHSDPSNQDIQKENDSQALCPRDYVTLRVIFFAGKIQCRVIAVKKIHKGFLFGKFEGKQVFINGPVDSTLSENSWEVNVSKKIFVNKKLVLIIDGGSNENNWLKFIPRAKNYREHNVDVVNDGKNGLLFIANQNIIEYSELFAWYRKNEIQSTFIKHDLKHLQGKNVQCVQDIPSLDVSANNIPLIIQKENITTKIWENKMEYLCETCGSVFNEKSYLERHQRFTACIDTKDRFFKCDDCGKSFEKLERMNVHKKQVHDKIKPYTCDICNKFFSQSSSLTKHKRIHTGERPYMCDICMKSFTASSILTTHRRQHTGERPFKCTLCDSKFASHAAHHSHIRRSHNIEPVQMRAIKIKEIKKQQ